ncbi:thiamine/thiamine pyrophosphate ABC transporter permease ThiP [Rhizobium deserti]|uniref:Thiamine/thiamine pyrophosphate ABC transporter permease ThiP n=1 Tax=Rhizobium deserti TaxID=2547961 RepID=A0A4R5UFX8_9HYPH|nr:thiamine/thiamine pyrophosphate ABC transporter permease ThiP [Rhizobium deserti]TDK34413.1 thiamine/thiamine pyrophosphate ABC transporter permease ThiP [Rhizobium deserti]
MLTGSEQRWRFAWGIAVLTGIFLFVGAAVAALLSWDTGALPSRFFTAYTWRILQFTLLQALLSTFLSVVLAAPVAMALARRPAFPGRIWIIRLMAVPMGLPVLIGALGLIGIWGRQGMVNSALVKLGMEQPVSIYGLSGILLAHVFFNLPLAARLLLAALERLSPEYWLLSSSLGMRPFSVFRLIEWPAIRRVLPGVAGLIFMLCVTSFTLVLVLGGGPAATTLEVAIYQALRFDFDPPRAIALASLQIGTTALILGAMMLAPGPGDGGVTAGRAMRRLDGVSSPARAWDGLMIITSTLFLAMPLASIFVAGLKADLWALVTSAAFLRAAWTSFAIAFPAAVLTILVSLAIIGARQAIADMRRPGRIMTWLSAVLGATSFLVLLVPPVVLGTGWFLILRTFGNVASFAAILVGLINMLMALPFVMRVLAPAVESHRRQTARLATSLGLSGKRRLWRIDLPVLARPILTAMSFAMVLSLGDLGAVALFGSSDLTTLPWLVYSRLASYRNNDADGLALLLGIICLVLTMLGTAGQRRQRHG